MRLKSHENWINDTRTSAIQLQKCNPVLKRQKFFLHKNIDGKVELVDQRKIIVKIADFTRAIFNHIVTIFKKLKRRLLAEEFSNPILYEGKLRYPANSLPWKNQQSNGLYLFIHGLRGSPTDWASYTKRIGQDESNATIFTPNVYAKGNISLEKAADPILEAVRDYLREHPGRPINIFGTSNGSRICTYIENNLPQEELGKSCLRIVSIAGILNGTKFIDFLEKYHLTFMSGLDPELQQEFKWESNVAKTTLHQWSEKQKIWNENNRDVRHFYCASLEDEQVRPIMSSLPNSNNTINFHKVFRGQTHTSIVEKACSKIFDWLNKNKAQ